MVLASAVQTVVFFKRFLVIHFAVKKLLMNDINMFLVSLAACDKNRTNGAPPPVLNLADRYQYYNQWVSDFG